MGPPFFLGMVLTVSSGDHKILDKRRIRVLMNGLFFS